MTAVRPAMTLEEMAKLRDPEEQVRAINGLIKYAEERLAEARRLRDAAVLKLVKKHGPAEAARRSGLSLSTVKLIKGRP